MIVLFSQRKGSKKFINTLGMIGLLLVLLTGCSIFDNSTGNYNSAEVFDSPIQSDIMKKTIAYEGVKRNPVIFVHGFLGSKLKSKATGKNVWGDFTAKEAFFGYSDEELRGLSYPMMLDKPLDNIPDNAISTEIMAEADVRIAGVDFKLNAYNKALDILQGCGYVMEGKPLPKNKNFYSLFVFHYDWRMDLVENSAILHKFLLEKREYLQKEYEKLYGAKDYDVKFDFVVHSMGGLLSRYYLSYGDQKLPEDGSMPDFNWEGGKYVEKEVIIATPNAGYLDAFYELLNGYSPIEGVDPYPPAVTGTWVTYYEMLPLLETRSVVFEDNIDGPSVDFFDPKLWVKYKWGLADPDQDENLQILLPDIKTAVERRKIAVDHLSKCLKTAKQFTDALKIYKAPPEHLKFYLYFGDAVETRRTAVVNRKTGEAKFTGFDSGDGIVCASSALLDTRAGQKWHPEFKSPITWSDITALMAAHVGLTECPGFANNIAYCLLYDLARKQMDE